MERLGKAFNREDVECGYGDRAEDASSRCTLAAGPVCRGLMANECDGHVGSNLHADMIFPVETERQR